jgi:MFS family permease
MHPRFGGLWRHGDFVKLWAGQTISMFGSQVSTLAGPLTAVLVLDATPLEMGLLTMVGALPTLLFGLFAGAWADRLRRRPILILTDLGRFLLLGMIPLLYLLGLLRMELLYLIGFLMGTLVIFFNMAAGAYLPTLIADDALVEGNSKLALSQSVSEIVGPGLAGVLVQLLSAPLALLADAFSFLVSALSLAGIRQAEDVPPPAAQGRDMVREIREGLRFVAGEPRLRAVLITFATLTLFNAVLEAVLLLYLTRDAGVAPALFGFAFAVGSIGSVLGAALADRITHRLGVGPVLLLAPLVIGASDLLLPLVGLVPLGAGVALLSVGQFFFGFALPLFSINQVSLRQLIAPPVLRGRVGASFAVVAGGAAPLLGALLGGVLGQSLGLPLTLVLAALGEILAGLWLVFSPVRGLRRLPAGGGDPAVGS